MKTCKEDAIKEIQQLIESNPELKDMPIASDGLNNFSLSQIIKEMETGTEAGLRMIANYCGN